MKKTGILITRHTKLLSIAAVIEVLRTVNECLEERGIEGGGFEFTLFATTDQFAFCKTTFGEEPFSLSSNPSLDLLLIPAFERRALELHQAELVHLVPFILKQYEQQSAIASFCTGVFPLAASGLLENRHATTHVEVSDVFKRIFPQVIWKTDHTVTQDGRLYTSGGATSTFHLLLLLIQQYCDSSMAVQMAKTFAIDMDRSRQRYFSTFLPPKNHRDELVASMQQKMERDFHLATTVEELMKDFPASRRNMARRFKQVTGMTPIAYLQQTRMEAAKNLLTKTGKQLSEVIFHSGYSDPKAFRNLFKKSVGMTPSEYREKFQLR